MESRRGISTDQRFRHTHVLSSSGRDVSTRRKTRERESDGDDRKVQPELESLSKKFNKGEGTENTGQTVDGR